MVKNKTKINATLFLNGIRTTTEVLFTNNSHSLFHNFQHIILKLNLNSVALAYLNYICERMDSNNEIQIDQVFNEEFILFANHIANKNVKSRTLTDLVKTFEENHLVIKHLGFTKLYIVNPKHFYNGSLTKRTELLTALLGIKYEGRIDKSALLNRPIDYYFTKE